MKIALVAPSLRDPAHARVLGALAEEYARAGDAIRVFPPRSGLTAVESRRALEAMLANVDLCHIHFFSRGLGWLSGARFPSRTKIVLTHQGAAFDFMERRDVFRALAARADAVTAVSRDGLRQLRALLPKTLAKTHWIPNGAALPASLPPAAAKFRRDTFILSVGRLAAYKGTDLLLMAFAELADERRDLRLMICGPDQAGGRLQRFAGRLGLEGRVSFLGATRAPAVARLVADCLFFVLPSRRENMPMALLDAMAAGKAVAAAKVGGVPEAVTHGVDGLLVPPEDAHALAASMRRLLFDPGLRARLGRAARESARSYLWPAVADRYRRLYARLVRGARGDAAKELEVVL
ncbi:MAG: glycosyltransferase family 4 protein [Elusimicrobia bacterium]|nr:glycosyltransferase family 4 protein [Elusimicrobiota bacterium]